MHVYYIKMFSLGSSTILFSVKYIKMLTVTRLLPKISNIWRPSWKNDRFDPV